MNHAAAQVVADENTTGLFNYLDGTVRSSLYRNGAVMTKRDADGYDSGTVGMCLEAKELSVSNARSLRGDERRTCEANGFELLNAPLEDDGIDFFDHDQIVRHYLRAVYRARGAEHGRVRLRDQTALYPNGSASSAPCTFSFHSAFEDPASPPDAPDRWSIEVRCMVIYD